VKLGGFVNCWLAAVAAFGQANPQTGASIEGHVVNSITSEPLDKAVVRLSLIGSSSETRPSQKPTRWVDSPSRV